MRRVLSITDVVIILEFFPGGFFRIWKYLYSGSFWLDEAWLANNVVQRSLGSLLIEPLASNQGAPLGFLFIVKCSTFLFGNTDLVLRIVPLIFGVLTLYLTYHLSFSVLKSTIARICLAGLISFSSVLIYYSSEFKQYSTDVFVSLLILWTALNFQKWQKGFLIIALAGGFGIWLSHPSVFVLTAVGITLILETLVSKAQIKSLFALWAVIAGWLASFTPVYLLSLRALADNNQLIDFWTDGYAPLPIDSYADLYWYWESALGLTYLAFFERGPVDTPALTEWFSALNIFLLAITIAGLAHILINSKRLFGIIILTIAVTLLFSTFRLYPFRARLILFLTPLVFISISSFVDWLTTCCNRSVKFFAYAGTACLVALLLLPSVKTAFNPRPHSDIENALDYVYIHHAPDDSIAMNIWSVPPFKFYSQHLKLDNMRVLGHFPNDSSPEEVIHTICQYQLFGRTWIIFSHQFDERTALIARLQSQLPQLASWEGNAGAYLFDISYTALCSDSVRGG